jgi:hypothetical protein
MKFKPYLQLLHPLLVWFHPNIIKCTLDVTIQFDRESTSVSLKQYWRSGFCNIKCCNESVSKGTVLSDTCAADCSGTAAQLIFRHDSRVAEVHSFKAVKVYFNSLEDPIRE